MKVLSEERKYSAQDFERLPEGPPYYQLINGELIMSPSPALEHQRTSKRLFHMLYTLIEIHKKGEVFYSPVDVYLDEENVFQPDIVVILEGSRAKMTKRGVEGAPDIVVEILSPSTGYYDLTIKKEVYERSGVKEYWVLDSQRRTFEIYKNTQEGFKLAFQAREKGKVFSEILGIEIDLQKVEERGIFGPPDVVVEILSPSTAYYDLIVKKEVYERVGVKEYWLLDPNRKTFEIYKNTEEGFKLSSQAREKGKVLSEILGLEIDLKDIYEGGI